LLNQCALCTFPRTNQWIRLIHSAVRECFLPARSARLVDLLLGRDHDRVALHLHVQLLGPVRAAVQRDAERGLVVTNLDDMYTACTQWLITETHY
jgi:hypothetical protein